MTGSLAMAARRTLAALCLIGAMLTSEAVGAAASPAPSGSAKQELISFTCDWGDVCTIWPDGTHLTKVRDNPGLGLAGPISPDGTMLVYFFETLGSYNGVLWVMAPDGSDRRLVSATEVVRYAGLTWSPDSRFVAYERGYDAGLGAIDVVTGTARTVVPTKATNPAWSPDGKWIAFQASGAGGRADLWKVRPDGTGLTRLTATPDVDEMFPAWSPDGGTVAFNHMVPTSHPWPAEVRSEIWSMRPDGSDQTLVVSSGEDKSGPGSPSYSPDGRSLVWADRPVDDGFDTNLYTSTVQGTNVRQLTFSTPTSFNRNPYWGAAVTEAPSCFGQPATILGAGRIEGTPGDDVIIGSAGRDVIVGGGGSDLICAGAGDDTVYANGARDRIDGGSGNDHLYGGSGNDALVGGPGTDVCDGRGGVDTATACEVVRHVP